MGKNDHGKRAGGVGGEINLHRDIAVARRVMPVEAHDVDRKQLAIGA